MILTTIGGILPVALDTKLPSLTYDLNYIIKVTPRGMSWFNNSLTFVLTDLYSKL